MQLPLVTAGTAAATLLMPALATLGAAVMPAAVVVMARLVACEYLPACPHTLSLRSISTALALRIPSFISTC